MPIDIYCLRKILEDCKETDILFVLDASSSIDESEWTKEKNFVANIVR